jgi:hypothetical protein
VQDAATLTIPTGIMAIGMPSPLVLTDFYAMDLVSAGRMELFAAGNRCSRVNSGAPPRMPMLTAQESNCDWTEICRRLKSQVNLPWI